MRDPGEVGSSDLRGKGLFCKVIVIVTAVLRSNNRTLDPNYPSVKQK